MLFAELLLEAYLLAKLGAAACAFGGWLPAAPSLKLLLVAGLLELAELAELEAVALLAPELEELDY